MDDLTGIANHRRFIEFFDLEWRRSQRNARPISIILVDVDFFKLYNDTYGHQAGDKCLKNIAETMDKIIKRPGDLVARYGGEEFVIVLSETSSEGAEIIAENLRIQIENLKIDHKKSSVAKHVTISLGCATVIPDQESNSSILIKAADEALYRSKKGGRNRLTVTSPSFFKT